MSKWLRRGFGGGSNTPTSVGGGGGPTAVYTPTAGGGGGMATGRQDSTYPLSHMEGAAAGGGGPNGATTGTTAPMPQAAYYYDPPPPTSHQQHNAAAAAATTKSRSNRTPGSTTAMTNTPQGPPPVGGGGEESSIHVHPPKVSRHVRTPSDPSRITAWGMMTTTTPAGRGGMISTRDAAPPPPYTTTNNNNDIAQPPPPGTTPTSIHANNNNTNNNNQNYNNHTSNYNNTTTTSTAYPQPNNANNNDSSIVDYSSSQLSNPQGGSMPRRPAYLLHRDLVIGKGSYGQVCIASRGEAEGGRSGKRKKFACKCVMLRSDPKYIAKLQEEVNVLRELRGHENVIRLYDVFCVENELFIITELGRGGDLFHLLTTHPKHGVTESYAGMYVISLYIILTFFLLYIYIYILSFLPFFCFNLFMVTPKLSLYTHSQDSSSNAFSCSLPTFQADMSPRLEIGKLGTRIREGCMESAETY
jgi:hypothetical protein